MTSSTPPPGTRRWDPSSPATAKQPNTRAESRLLRKIALRNSRINLSLAIVGEIMLTFGVVLLLFVFWQLVWNDRVLAGSQSEAAVEFSEELASDQPDATDDPVVTPPADPSEPEVMSGAPTDGTAFGVLYVPRFGEGTQRRIAEGVGFNVLNSNRLGIGHYPGTGLPGQEGNFAIAGHRSAFGGAMHLIDKLRVGDAIYVQTKQGWYTYRFRNLEYVPATAIEVLNPTPQGAAAATNRYITLTSCNPLYSTAERIIAYGVLESWRPASEGPPEEIRDDVESWSS